MFFTSFHFCSLLACSKSSKKLGNLHNLQASHMLDSIQQLFAIAEKDKCAMYTVIMIEKFFFKST